jgi:hypothetical protein
VGDVDEVRTYGRPLTACDVEAVRTGDEADADADGIVDVCEEPSGGDPGEPCTDNASCLSGNCNLGICDG